MAGHSPITLISDLALILCTAGVTTLIFKKLKQPVVLGYIIAGFLVGPHFDFFPSITGSGDSRALADGEIDENIRTWSEIGVIFLLFTLGLEFSFKKLMRVGGTSSITSFVQIICMLFLGYFAGQLMDWPMMDSIFLGAILSVSSTTIIIRAFEELNYKDKKFAGVVFGALIVEDLVAIVLMVLLSTMAVSRDIQEGELLISMVKLVFFLILWFAAGIFFIPSFLRYTRKLMNDETLLIVSIGLCFAMVLLAEKVGFSQALGAFIMGSILAETTSAERIEHLVKPVKDLFGAVFFVSVGMMIVPSTMVEHAVPILIVTLITLFGKTASTFLGALLSGQPLKQSVQVGMSLAQIGEFSFIIAQLGLTLKVTSEFLYPVTIAVSAITTFTTPYLIKMSEPVYNLIERKLPSRWIANLNRYSTGAQHINAESEWKKLIKSFFQIAIINGTVIAGIIVLFSKVIAPSVFPDQELATWQAILVIIATLICASPFLWALTVRKMGKAAYTTLWLNKVNRGPIIALEFLRIALAIFLVGFMLDQFFSTLTALVLASTVIVIAIVIFSRKLQTFSSRIEMRFVNNFNAREIKEAENKIDNLSPWDAHIASFEVPYYSFVVGKKLSELALREQFGINIAMIERGDKKILVPNRDELLYPKDRISVIGTDDQLLNFKSRLEEQTEMPESHTKKPADVELIQVTVEPGFPYVGVSIRESGIREQTQGLIVGIERDGERILNPDSTTEFRLKDTLWIVGNKKLVKQFMQ
ncbi:MAG TPA: cation:proton antiporter [Flavobacteriales bacterium]